MNNIHLNDTTFKYLQKIILLYYDWKTMSYSLNFNNSMSQAKSV